MSISGLCYGMGKKLVSRLVSCLQQIWFVFWYGEKVPAPFEFDLFPLAARRPRYILSVARHSTAPHAGHDTARHRTALGRAVALAMLNGASACFLVLSAIRIWV